MNFWLTCILVLVCSFFLSTCINTNQARKWEIEMNGVSSFSSPRVADLNLDGVSDIVIGAGSAEWFPSDSGIIALDGKNGKILWHAAVKNQIVGSASFIRINNDELPDIVIGGRTGELYALDGKTGAKIWQFYKPSSPMSYRDDGCYNFYNSQIIRDVNNDQIDDILICNGGDPYIQDHITKRPVGKLMILSGCNGEVISSAEVPDGKETYFSPIITNMGNSGNELRIIFGTGGETIGGALFSCKLSDLLKSNIRNAKVLHTDSIRGFIAPPILADVNGDGIYDVVANSSSGRTFAIDGKNDSKLWDFQYTNSQVEVYSSPAIGYFTGDDRVFDFFVCYSKGNFPNYYGSLMFLLDGKSGKVVRKYEGVQFTYVSPLTFDVNNDLVDDVVYVSNREEKTSSGKNIYTGLEVFDFKMDSTYKLVSPLPGANFAMTPWIGDLDNNGKVDIIYSSTPAYTNRYPGTSSLGDDLNLKVTYRRAELLEKRVDAVLWGAYMGNDYTSTLKHPRRTGP
jgi:outer membrane protein assembly factor BamB